MIIETIDVDVDEHTGGQNLAGAGLIPYKVARSV
jgi:hypothetical protein